jgi:meso-butanediol dehydrogenase / (S,S)-butanediol dehydrogenase / diacetyl reductase
MSNGRLRDKVAIVTGSTKGIGEALVTGFAREGAKVVVCGRSAERGAELARSITADGGTAHFVQFDLGDEQSVANLVHETVSHYGRLDIIVNNAHPTEHTAGGAAGLDQKVDNVIGELSTEAWRKLTLPTFDGLFWALREALKQFQKQGGTGTIINISSMVSNQGLAGVDIHTATKGAMNALTRSIAVEYAPHVRCNTIVAGLVATGGIEGMVKDPVIGPALAGCVLTNRIAAPSDFVGVATFLAAEEESFFITGQCINVDGGMGVMMPIPKLEATVANT